MNERYCTSYCVNDSSKSQAGNLGDWLRGALDMYTSCFRGGRGWSCTSSSSSATGLVIGIEIDAELAELGEEEAEAGMLERAASTVKDAVRPVTLLQEDGILMAVPATKLTAAHWMLLENMFQVG